MTCSKLAVLNKAIQGTFFKSQKSKNRLKRQILIYLRKAVANRAIHGTFLSLKKVKKRIYRNYRSIFACDLKKCPGLLYLPLLTLIKISNSSKEQQMLLLIFLLFEISVKLFVITNRFVVYVRCVEAVQRFVRQ